MSDRAAIDLLSGGSELRAALEAGDAEALAEFYRGFRAYEDAFANERRAV